MDGYPVPDTTLLLTLSYDHGDPDRGGATISSTLNLYKSDGIINGTIDAGDADSTAFLDVLSQVQTP